MPLFGQELFLQANEKGRSRIPPTSRRVRHVPPALARRGHRRRDGRSSFGRLVAPSGGPAWIIDPVNGDHYVGGNTTPAAVAGYPSVCVPAGFAFGLPVGVSFIGRAWTEPTLIRIASALERATGHRRPPGFAPQASMR